MKKFLIVLVALALLFACACATPSDSQEASDLVAELEALKNELDALKNEAPTDTLEPEANVAEEPTIEFTQEPVQESKPGVFVAEEVKGEIGINEYRLSSYYYYAIYVLENNSEFTLDLSMQLVFKDAEGKNIGAQSDSDAAFAPGTSIALVFSNETAFDSCEYIISVKEETYYAAVTPFIEVEANIAGKKAVLSATNTGSIVAEFVQFTVLFFNGDTLVDYDWGYIVDDDSEIKPGNTEFKEATSYKESFDSIQVYLSGRGDK